MPFDPTQPYSIETTDGGAAVYIQGGSTYTINGVPVGAPALNVPEPDLLGDVIAQAEAAWDDTNNPGVLPNQPTAILQGLVAQFGGTWVDGPTALAFLAQFNLK